MPPVNPVGFLEQISRGGKGYMHPTGLLGFLYYVIIMTTGQTAMIRALITNAYSTVILYPPGKRPKDPYSYLFTAAQLTKDQRDYHKQRVMTEDISFEALLKDFRDDGIRLHNPHIHITQANRLMDAHRTHALLNPEYAGFLQQADEMGLHIGLISNLAAPFKTIIDDLIPQAHITKIYSCDIGATKDDPDLYHYALARLNHSLEPQHAVMIGDSFIQDYQNAKRAGLHALWYPTHNSYAQTHYKTHERIADLRDTVPFLQARRLLPT